MIFKTLLYFNTNIDLYLNVPSFSEIIDISINLYSNDVEVIYINNVHNDLFENKNDKLINVWITDDVTLTSPPEYYKFYKVVEIKQSEVDLSRTNNGIVNVLERASKYFIFLKIHETISELRNMKINKLTEDEN